MEDLSSEERLRLDNVALRVISQGVLITGVDRRIVSANSAFEVITGFGESEVVGSNCNFLQGPLTDPHAIQTMRDNLSRGVEFYGEVLNYRKDGQPFWNELTITPAHDEDGRLTHFIGVCRDVTDRVKARELLVEHKTRAIRKSDELKMVLGNMSQGISCFDNDRRLTVWNTQYAQMFSMNTADIRAGISFVELLQLQKSLGNFDGDCLALQDKILDHVKAGLIYRSQARLTSGRIISSINSPRPEGGWICTHEDITEQHARSEQLANTSRQLTTALASMRQGLAMFDAQRTLVVSNNKYGELLGLGEDCLHVGMTLRELLHARVRAGTFSDDVESALVREADALRGNNSYETSEFTADGRVLSAFVKSVEGGGFVVTHEDITEQHRIEAQIEHDAMHDALTGLPNRRFLDRVLAAREKTCRESGDGIAVLHIDLDHFKQINDTLGHEAGDAMLVHATSVLKASLGEGDFVSRSGGDEFVLVCSVKKGSKELAELAGRIVGSMRKPVVYRGHECRFGVSIGISHQRGHKVDARKLLINADLALYQAKSRGRGCHQFFTPAMQAVVTRTKRLADEIQSGVERGEFVAHYQPQVDARTRKISGVEALVRWQHPRRGLLAPASFLKTAEDMGAVATIDRVVLAQALGSHRKWIAMGLDVPRVSVNVSARRLHEPHLLKSLKRLAIPPDTVSFELLESIYLDEADDLVAWNIDQIRELGIEIEVDDFGTGHTSILSLVKLKPQRLKIDRQLVAPIVGSPQQQQLVRTMVEIGHSLGIRVIAEGIETLEHAAIAESLGCDELQGYAFSRPLSADQFEAFARSTKARGHGADGLQASGG